MHSGRPGLGNQATDHSVQHRRSHRAQVGQRLVAVLALVEIHLSHAVEADGPPDIDQQGDVDAVAGHEGQCRQQVSAHGDLAGQGLVESRQLWRFVMAPHYSGMSIGGYIQRAKREQARRA